MARRGGRLEIGQSSQRIRTWSIEYG
jgi:hypothetical protein